MLHIANEILTFYHTLLLLLILRPWLTLPYLACGQPLSPQPLATMPFSHDLSMSFEVVEYVMIPFASLSSLILLPSSQPLFQCRTSAGPTLFFGPRPGKKPPSKRRKEKHGINHTYTYHALDRDTYQEKEALPHHKFNSIPLKPAWPHLPKMISHPSPLHVFPV